MIRRSTFGGYLTNKYVEVHDDFESQANTQVLYTFHALYLGPSSNRQGTLTCFNLKIGVVKKVWNMTKPPTSLKIIAKFNKWGKKSTRE